MAQKMERGAKIIIRKWVRIKPWDRLLIVTSKEHLNEARELRKQAFGHAYSVNTLIVENKGRHVGVFFDENEDIFDPYTAIIAATEYSLVTTKAAKKAIQKKKKFLSLPLSTNDGRSMLEYDFLMMDTKKSRLMAKVIMKYLKNSSKIRVTTAAGTDLQMEKEDENRDFSMESLKMEKAIHPPVSRSTYRSRRQRQKGSWCWMDPLDISDGPKNRPGLNSGKAGSLR